MFLGTNINTSWHFTTVFLTVRSPDPYQLNLAFSNLILRNRKRVDTHLSPSSSETRPRHTHPTKFHSVAIGNPFNFDSLLLVLEDASGTTQGGTNKDFITITPWGAAKWRYDEEAMSDVSFLCTSLQWAEQQKDTKAQLGNDWTAERTGRIAVPLLISCFILQSIKETHQLAVGLFVFCMAGEVGSSNEVFGNNMFSHVVA